MGAARRPPARGRFITFEGGEGAGKSTQVRRLAERIERTWRLRVTTTREPGGTPAAEAIRGFVLGGAAKELGPDGEAFLFAAARADHVDKLIRPALAAGDWVICDRFIDSTRAYQGTAGADLDLVLALERIAVGATMPDLTLILDLPAKAGMARVATRGGNGARPDRFEADTIAEHERRREAFLWIAEAEPERCVVIDASGSEGEVAAAVWRAVEGRFMARAA
jgi:dTMP kinase